MVTITYIVKKSSNKDTIIAQTPSYILNTGYIRSFLAQKPQPKTLPDIHPSAQDTIDTLQMPVTKFRSWTGFNQIPNPREAHIYKLKEEYSLNEVKSLARQLAAFDVVKDYKNHVMSYTLGKKGQAASLLLFNKSTGEFAYSATNGIILPQNKQSTPDKIYSFLKELGLYDPSLKITATYKKNTDPEITYYEIKRDWKTAGLPILNPIGLLNLDESESISKLQINATTNDPLENAEIYNTSDKTDGLERKTDFNTMTIAVTDIDESVVIIKSNIRALESTKTQNAALISYADAISKLKQNIDSFILTTPAGLGSVIAWEKIYPQHLAEAETATVTDSSIAYLENSPGAEQKTLQPYYLFKGTAELNSQYKVNFIAAVSATNTTEKTKASINPFSFTLIPQVHAQAATQKQKTFPLIVTPFPTPTPLPHFSTCVPAVDQLNPRYEQNASDPNLRSRVSFGWSPVAVIKGEIRLSRRGWWFYVPSQDTTEANLRDDINQVFIQIRAITNRRDFRKFNDGTPPNILEDYRATGNACPIRVTGDSPTIFVYAPAGTKLNIAPSSTSYADPQLINSRWQIETQANGSIQVNGNQRNYLYYEYIDTKFKRPNLGWNIKKSELSSFITNLSKQLFLYPTETNRLAFELNHAAEEITADTLFIGIIDSKELYEKLPLSLDHKPDSILRYFFYVGSKKGKTTPPNLNPVERKDFMILEIGSYSEK